MFQKDPLTQLLDYLFEKQDEYNKELVELNIKIQKLENKIKRMRSGGKKQHTEYLVNIKKLEIQYNEILSNLQKENEELKIALSYRQEFYDAISECKKMTEVEDLLEKFNR